MTAHEVVELVWYETSLLNGAAAFSLRDVHSGIPGAVRAATEAGWVAWPD